jgi:hypothetical protein
MRKKKNDPEISLMEIMNKIISLEVEIQLLKRDVKLQNKLIFIILTMLLTIFVKVLVL